MHRLNKYYARREKCFVFPCYCCIKRRPFEEELLSEEEIVLEARLRKFALFVRLDHGCHFARLISSLTIHSPSLGMTPRPRPPPHRHTSNTDFLHHLHTETAERCGTRASHLQSIAPSWVLRNTWSYFTCKFAVKGPIPLNFEVFAKTTSNFAIVPLNVVHGCGPEP